MLYAGPTLWIALAVDLEGSVRAVDETRQERAARRKWSLDCPSGRLGFEGEGVKTAAIAPISLFRSLPKQHPALSAA